MLDNVRVISGQRHGSTYHEATDRDITFYVDPGGSDTALGTSGAPLLTIQEAVNRLPRFIGHTVRIIVNAGTYAGVAIEGFTIGDNGTSEGSLTLEGVLAAPTIGGLTSGTADSGDKVSMTKAGAGWVAGELEGMWLLVAGEYRAIYDNTTTQIYVSSEFTSNVGTQAFSIVESKSILNTLEGFASQASVYVAGCVAGNKDQLVVKNLNVQSPASAPSGIYVKNSSSCTLTRCRISCASAGDDGVVLHNISGEYAIEDVYVHDDFDETGILLQAAHGTCAGFRAALHDVDGVSLKMVDCGPFGGSYGTADFTVADSTGNAVEIVSCRRVQLDRMLSAGTNAALGVVVDNSWVRGLEVNGTVSGTHGVSVLPGGYFEFPSTGPNITGATADATVNEAASDLDWSTNFPTNGSAAPNSDTMASVVRRD